MAVLSGVRSLGVDLLKKTWDRAAAAGARTERRVLEAARALEIPAVRIDEMGELPILARDAVADRLAKGSASLAAVTCGAAGAIPVAGLALELFTLAELNVVQVDHIARAYGFRLGSLPTDIADKLPLGGARALLLVPILGALEVRALERDGKMESLTTVLSGALDRAEIQAIAGRLAGAAALAMLKKGASESVGTLLPAAGSAIAAWSAFAFTSAVGEEARKYFRDLATGDVVVKGRRAN